MAFSRNEEKKELSLPGLIDIIFLLLIFSLVTLSISQAKVETQKKGNRDFDLDLPETKSRESEALDEVLQTLLFQIEHVDNEDQDSPKILFVLRPSVKDSLTLQEAKTKAIADSLFAVFPEDFIDLSDGEFARTRPCRLIRRAIREHKETYFFKPDPTNAVEIRAVADTEFRIMNFIMEQCSAYGDTIPRFMLRTFMGREVTYGF
ncbi:MAG: hypothetical protein ABIL68_17830 [bacterium]